MPNTPNHREGPQARGPKTGQRGQRLAKERLAKEAFQLPATRGSKKGSDRTITPMAKSVRFSAHRVLPGSPQAKQLHHLHAQLPLGQSCHRKKKSFMSMHAGLLQPYPTLQPYRLWPARLLCQRGGSPGKNNGVCWPILVAIPF